MALAACSRQPPPDAYGNAEAIEVTVSAESSGRLTSFSPEEGQALAAGATIGEIDAAQLSIERTQADAQRAVNASRAVEVAEQVPVLEAQRAAARSQQAAATSQRAALAAQLEIARRAYERTQRLNAQQAATAQQLDQAEREYRVLEQQVKAQDEQIAAQARQIDAQTRQLAAVEAQRRTASSQVAVAEAQVAQVDERIRKTRVINPSAGTVLVTYARPGEVVQAGQPLYRIANLDPIDVRAYITEPQLSTVRIGQAMRVSVDAGSGRQTLNGTVSWVSSQAEFTPTPIQTRDERSDHVYAIKLRVPNPNGLLKIGMPVDVEIAR
jgi:HlyD family secretion protein